MHFAGTFNFGAEANCSLRCFSIISFCRVRENHPKVEVSRSMAYKREGYPNFVFGCKIYGSDGFLASLYVKAFGCCLGATSQSEC